MTGHESEMADVLACCRTACREGYRSFLEDMNTAVSRLVRSEGRDMAQRYVTVGGPPGHHGLSGVAMMFQKLLTPLVPIELQKRLWNVIGFQDLGENLMYLSDFEGSRVAINSFRHIAYAELEISAGDPERRTPLQERVDTPASVVAYFSYHLFMGVNMRIFHLKWDSLHDSVTGVRFSAEAVEKATHRIGIMVPNSESMNVWNEYKRQAFLCAETMDESLKGKTDETFLVLKGLLLSELSYCGSVSQRLVDLWQYGQNIDFLLGHAYTGGEFNPTNSSICLETSHKFGENAFTEEYMDRLSAVRNFLTTASHRSLSDDEMFRMNAILKWQSEHFLSCVCSEAFDDQWTASCATCPSYPTEGAVDPYERSSDGEEKSDRPEKVFTLHSPAFDEKSMFKEGLDEMEVDHCDPIAPDMTVTMSQTALWTKENGQSRSSQTEEVTTAGLQFSVVCQSLTEFDNQVLHWCLKETLDFVKERSDLTAAAVSVLAFLCDVETVPSLYEALD